MWVSPLLAYERSFPQPWTPSPHGTRSEHSSERSKNIQGSRPECPSTPHFGPESPGELSFMALPRVLPEFHEYHGWPPEWVRQTRLLAAHLSPSPFHDQSPQAHAPRSPSSQPSLPAFLWLSRRSSNPRFSRLGGADCPHRNSSRRPLAGLDGGALKTYLPPYTG